MAAQRGKLIETRFASSWLPPSIWWCLATITACSNPSFGYLLNRIDKLDAETMTLPMRSMLVLLSSAVAIMVCYCCCAGAAAVLPSVSTTDAVTVEVCGVCLCACVWPSADFVSTFRCRAAICSHTVQELICVREIKANNSVLWIYWSAPKLQLIYASGETRWEIW